MGFIKTPEQIIRDRNKFKQAADKDPEIGTLGYDFKGLMFDSFEEDRGKIFPSPKPSYSSQQSQQPVKSTDSLEDYILLEGVIYGCPNNPDYLVSKKLDYYGKTWYETHKLLSQNNQLMMNPRQFVGLINLLRSDSKVYDGKGKQIDKYEVKKILHDIINLRDPHQAEWLDARFDVLEDKFYINYNHRTTSDGELVPMNSLEPLKPCLMQDSYVYFFRFFNGQGMPTKKSGNSRLHYRPPQDNTIVRYKVDSRKLGLFCNWWPTDSDPFNGVRPVLVKKY